MFNHFLIVGDEPMLFHCGLRKMFPLVSEAVSRIISIQKLRWLGFGHFEADECGSMNEWLSTPRPHSNGSGRLSARMITGSKRS
jgi:flavorubredoxin